MKKSLIVFLLILICGISGILCGHVRLMKSGRNVTFQETVICGDRKEAEGLYVKEKAQILALQDRYLSWEIEYSVADGKAEDIKTSADRSLFQEQEKGTVQDDLLLSLRFVDNMAWTSYGVESDVIDVSYYPELADEMNKMKQETAVRESCQKSFRPKDYMDDYPVSVIENLSEGRVIWRDDQGTVLDKIEDIDKKLSAAFQIPLSGDESFQISYTKTSETEESVTTLLENSRVTDYFSECLYLEEGIYLAVDVQAEGVDTSSMNGLYFLPWEQSPEGVILKGMYKVYPDATEQFIRMWTNEDQSCLLLLTKDRAGCMLRVIPREKINRTGNSAENTGSDGILEIPLNLAAGGLAYGGSCTGKNLWVIWDASGQFSAVSEGADGVFTTVLTGNLGVAKDFAYFDGGTGAAFRNGKLALCGGCDAEPENSNLCGFAVAVYDASGIQYAAKYPCSLNQKENSSDSLPSWNQTLNLWWK